MVRFANDISNKYITIGDYMTNIYLPSITVNYKMNQNPRIHRDYNYLISTAQVREFVVAVKSTYKCHGENSMVIPKTKSYK